MIMVLSSGSFLHRLNDAAHFVVDVSAIAREDLHNSREEPAMLGWNAVPGRQTGRARRGNRVRLDDAELLLTFKRHLAVSVPTHVELAFELVDPAMGSGLGAMPG